MKTLQELTRPNIWRLKPYSSARDEYSGAAASVFLDANENPYNLPHNRYPDPMQRDLKLELSKIKKVAPSHIFLGMAVMRLLIWCFVLSVSRAETMWLLSILRTACIRFVPMSMMWNTAKCCFTMIFSFLPMSCWQLWMNGLR